MLKVNDDYSICILCANLSDGMYGDIYTSIEECLLEHPDDEIIYGYGIVDNKTNQVADWADDWYSTIDKAIYDISNA